MFVTAFVLRISQVQIVKSLRIVLKDMEECLALTVESLADEFLITAVIVPVLMVVLEIIANFLVNSAQHLRMEHHVTILELSVVIGEITAVIALV